MFNKYEKQIELLKKQYSKAEKNLAPQLNKVKINHLKV